MSWLDPDMEVANGIAATEQSDMLRLDAMILMVQLNIRKLVEVGAVQFHCHMLDAATISCGGAAQALVMMLKTERGMHVHEGVRHSQDRRPVAEGRRVSDAEPVLSITPADAATACLESLCDAFSRRVAHGLWVCSKCHAACALVQEQQLPDLNIICEKLAFEGVTRFEDRYRLPVSISVNCTAYAAKLLAEVGAADGRSRGTEPVSQCTNMQASACEPVAADVRNTGIR